MQLKNTNTHNSDDTEDILTDNFDETSKLRKDWELQGVQGSNPQKRFRRPLCYLLHQRPKKG